MDNLISVTSAPHLRLRAPYRVGHNFDQKKRRTRSIPTLANQDSKGLSNNAHLTQYCGELVGKPLAFPVLYESQSESFAAFRIKPRLIPKVVNFAQIPDSQEIKKVAALKVVLESRHPHFAGAKGEI
jgi:hypothetical protein